MGKLRAGAAGPAPAAPILPGLPGADTPYMPAAIRRGLEQDYRLEAMARVAAFRLDGFIRSDDATRYGFPQPVADVAAERERIKRARARAVGLDVQEPEERPDEVRGPGGLILPKRRPRPRQRPRLWTPGKDPR